MRLILALLCFMMVSSPAWAITPAMIGAVSHVIASYTNILGFSYNSNNLDYFSLTGCGRFREVSYNQAHTKILGVCNSNDKIMAMTLSTPDTISSISYDGAATDLSTLSFENNPQGFAVSPDLSKIFVSGFTNDTIIELSCSSPGNPSSCSTNGNSLALLGLGNFFAFDFANNGNTLLVTDGSLPGVIYSYSVPTAYTLDANVTLNNGTVTIADPGGAGPFFYIDATKTLVVAGLQNDYFYQYNCENGPNNLADCSYSNNSFAYLNEDTHASGMLVSLDLSKIILIGGVTDFFYEYE